MNEKNKNLDTVGIVIDFIKQIITQEVFSSLIKNLLSKRVAPSYQISPILRKTWSILLFQNREFFSLK